MTSRNLAALLVACALSCRGGGGAPSPPSDLLGRPYIIFAPAAGEEIASPVLLGGEARPALAAPVPAEFRYRLRVPRRALLTFSIGILSLPSSSGEDLPGSRLQFTIKAGETAPRDALFDRSIHVSRQDRWLAQSVDLGRYAGREIWLTFQTSFPGYDPADPPPPFAGVFAEPILHDRAAYRRSRGVVLVSIDTLRRDHVSVYGYPRRTTPGLEAFARQAVVFEDAVSTSSWTLPAHASLLTSTQPAVHGAVSSEVGLSPEWPRLAGILQEAGYFTEAMVTHVYLSREYGFGEGFDRHRYLPDARAEELTDHAVRFLEARGDSDFFLFLHYYDPHWHYDPPPPYDRAFDPAYQGTASGIWWDFKELDRESIDPADLRHIVALYDGEISYTDRHVERLFQEMKRLGMFENALVVVTSDHGEEFLDHGRWEHQKTLYEEQLRIPLLIKLPAGELASQRVAGQVSLVDVAPTILDALAVPIPSSFEGRSLLDRLRAGSILGENEAWAETEHTLDGSRKIALRRGERSEKAIFSLTDNGVELELFDLARDPKELDDLAGGSGTTAELASRITGYLEDAEARRAGKERSPEVELSPEDQDRLRSLGYVK